MRLVRHAIGREVVSGARRKSRGGVTDNKRVSLYPFDKCYRLMKCHKCQIEMPDYAVAFTPFRNHAGVCENCAPSAWGLCHQLWERHYGDPAPCSHCGRPVANPKYGSRKWYALRFCTSTCSTRCRVAAHRAERHNQEVAA